MAALAEQPYNSLFTQQQRADDYTSYPEPPQNAFGSASPMAIGVTYPPSTTSMGFEPSLFAETPNYILNSHTSPGVYPEDGEMRLSSSGLSSGSLPSAPSSAAGSPQSSHGHLGATDWIGHTMNMQPSIVGSDYLTAPEYFHGSGVEDFGSFDFGGQAKSFVDPSLIHPEIARPPMPLSPYDGHFQHAQPHQFVPSPSLSSSPQPNLVRPDSTSPFLHSGPFGPSYTNSPYGAPIDANGRRVSMHNFISPVGSADFSSDETKEKQRCTYPDCGKIFKDLKAHMLTHQNERPEKCPIQTCEYHIKGFARKYDKNRHTLTHYKGTMVCGFCPGSGSPAEKSFNRADVFKRHLTAVHGVEQTPPNSRKKTPAGVTAGKKLTGYASDATGKCSTCSQTFSNAQDFYEHLDDCVLRIVQQEDPAEVINAQRLAEVENDKTVHLTLEKNNLPTVTSTMQASQNEDDDVDLDMGEEEEADDASSKANSSPSIKKKGNPASGVQKSRGLTHSRGGVPTATKARGRKNRRDYPSSWGFDKGQMTMRKRIMAVFDGPRRLAKDDMMLSTDHEVRIKLSDGKSYVTDLDVQTLKRAEGFLGATDDEKGPWISDDPTEEQLKEMQEMLKTSSAPI
ncbi:Zinc finger, C2H2-type/integrase, DNA-binding protein [Metarhizium album ARSEF 1941]|uniref:Zinc finger, C2H2-type/integrase, DNA-binding protein n=1 Tax=Metarhizium album (strain ARSEF 1941) TaxID=1081103 RepID=A0A0B2X629_METAS|nr:Zinc finger, C2H2-type/integrase, DNA-binding protein [Metarhizium album ARSEF 1941]KHO00925.1 Zinc finger, C2H2-type/integrase, DNA-binding protein [Metarhizium album ARSEF 1941]